MLHDKAKPPLRRGQKAAGLSMKMAELPKDIPLVCLAFLFYTLNGADRLPIREVN